MVAGKTDPEMERWDRLWRRLIETKPALARERLVLLAALVSEAAKK